jgi:hypothetical protein
MGFVMPVCPTYSNENEPEFLFCSNCGAKIESKLIVKSVFV